MLRVWLQTDLSHRFGDVRDLGVADAALWIAARFEVPTIPAGKRLVEPDRWRGQIGHEGLELLVKSGLWGTLSGPAQSIAPVLLAMSEKNAATDHESSLQLSYVGISRYSGIQSPNAVRKALLELGEIGFLTFPEAGLRRSPSRQAALYIVTPNSEALLDSAHAFAAQLRSEVAAEREIRKRLRQARIQALRKPGGSLHCWAGQGGSNAAPLPHTPIPASSTDQPKPKPAQRAGTKYKPLYPTDSAKQQNAIPRIARSLIPDPGTDSEGNG